VLPPKDDYVVFLVSLLFSFVALWVVLCIGSLRRGRITIAEGLALVLLVAMAFGFASWL
jgi:hypothetical protein